MSTNEVKLWQQAYEQLDSNVRDRWDLDQIKTIKATVAAGLNPHEFRMGMAIAAKYELDPLLKEIWFIKSKGGKLLIMVGRDGLLRNARRDASFAGFDSDVVRKSDQFKVERQGNGERVISHSYEGGIEARGVIIGAWAQVYQMGKPSVYFFAPWSEYVPSNLDNYSPWKNQPSVMIQKCALSLCLRLAFNLSGVVGEEEAARMFEEMAPESAVGATVAVSEVRNDFLPEFRERFDQVYAEASAVRPGSLSALAIQMAVKGQKEADQLSWLEGQERLNQNARERAAEEENVTDAEVVDGPEKPSEDEIASAQYQLEELYAQAAAMEAVEADPSEVYKEINVIEKWLREAGVTVDRGEV